MGLELLLVVLLISEPSLPEDETCVTEEPCWLLRRKLLLSRLKGPAKHLEMVLTQKEHDCVYFHGDCMHVAEQLKLKSLFFYWECSRHNGDTNQEIAGIIPKNHFPALVCSFLFPHSLICV